MHNKSDNREVHKKVSTVYIIDGEIKEATSVQNCKIKIAYKDVTTFNYCYIPKFGRYYYITDMQIESGQFVVLTLRCDVLMTFYNSFKDSYCIALRSSSKYNNNIEDKEVAKLPTSKYIVRKLNTQFSPSDSAGCYVLTLGGGQ